MPTDDEDDSIKDGSAGGPIRWQPDANAQAAAEAAKKGAPVSWETAFASPPAGAAPAQPQQQQQPPAAEPNPFFNNYEYNPLASSTAMPALPSNVDFAQPSSWSQSMPAPAPQTPPSQSFMESPAPTFTAPTPFAPPQGQAPQGQPGQFGQPAPQAPQAPQGAPSPFAPPQNSGAAPVPNPVPNAIPNPAMGQQAPVPRPQAAPAPIPAPAQVQAQPPAAPAKVYPAAPSKLPGASYMVKQYFTPDDIAEEIRKEQAPKQAPHAVANPFAPGGNAANIAAQSSTGTTQFPGANAANIAAQSSTGTTQRPGANAANIAAQSSTGTTQRPGANAANIAAQSSTGTTPRPGGPGAMPGQFDGPGAEGGDGGEPDLSAIPEIESGRIWENRTAKEILTGILKNKRADYAVALLASTDMSVQGEMLIVKSVVIHGAKLVEPDLSGYEALKVMLAIPHGTYTLLDVSQYVEQAQQLEQGLNLRISPLLNALPNLPKNLDELTNPTNISRIRSQGPADLDSKTPEAKPPKPNLTLAERLPPPKILILSGLTVAALITMLVVLFNR